MSELIVDIEVAPNDYKDYFEKTEEEKLKLLNPIDSKIIAIGIKQDNNYNILSGDEKLILKLFWEELDKNKSETIVGFNIKNFDVPFLTARSFINNIKITPFTIKNILDLRENINAFRYGQTRGKLKEYAELLGIETMEVDGSDVAKLYFNNELDTIKEYLKKDLDITEAVLKRAKETNITKIARW